MYLHELENVVNVLGFGATPMAKVEMLYDDTMSDPSSDTL